MKTRSMHSALLGLALLAGGLSLSPQAATQADPVPFPTPSAGMTLEGGKENGTKLEDLLLEFGRVSGEHLIWSEDTAQVLRASRTGLDRQLVVPAEELYSVIESILITNRFVLTDLRREEPRMLAVYSLDSPARSNIRANATYVPAEELHLYADHPAILINTTLHLPRIDVRTMGNAMRAMVVDPNTMQLIPIPASNQLILTGFGSEIAKLVAMLREVDANSPERVQQPEKD